MIGDLLISSVGQLFSRRAPRIVWLREKSLAIKSRIIDAIWSGNGVALFLSLEHFLMNRWSSSQVTPFFWQRKIIEAICSMQQNVCHLYIITFWRIRVLSFSLSLSAALHDCFSDTRCFSLLSVQLPTCPSLKAHWKSLRIWSAADRYLLYQDESREQMVAILTVKRTLPSIPRSYFLVEGWDTTVTIWIDFFFSLSGIRSLLPVQDHIQVRGIE